MHDVAGLSAGAVGGVGHAGRLCGGCRCRIGGRDGALRLLCGRLGGVGEGFDPSDAEELVVGELLHRGAELRRVDLGAGRGDDGVRAIDGLSGLGVRTVLGLLGVDRQVRAIEEPCWERASVVRCAELC